MLSSVLYKELVPPPHLPFSSPLFFQAAAELIDSYLFLQCSPPSLTSSTSPSHHTAASPAPLVTIAEFRQLVCALPSDARPSHDLLLKAVLAASSASASSASTTGAAAAGAPSSATVPAVTAAAASGAGASSSPSPSPSPSAAALSLVGLLDCDRLSPQALEEAGTNALLPLHFRIAALRIQKEVSPDQGFGVRFSGNQWTL